MQIEDLKKKSQNTLSELRFLRLVLLLLSSGMLLIAFYIVNQSTETKVQINVPPEITKNFWVSTHGNFDKSYLEQMGTFIAYLVLNVTPKSIEFQSDILKPYLSPEAFGKFQTDVDAKRKRLDKYQISTAFHPQQIFLSKSGKCRIQVQGMMQTFVGGTQTKEKQTKLNIDCENINGRFYVTGIALDDAVQL